MPNYILPSNGNNHTNGHLEDVTLAELATVADRLTIELTVIRTEVARRVMLKRRRDARFRARRRQLEAIR